MAESGGLVEGRQRGGRGGGGKKNECGQLGGDRLGSRVADVEPGDMASRWYVAQLAHKPLIVGKA
ncbi:hypothetical protein, partial [Salmonella enterica]|uniref:hypothetical protein n=1 Tax=Salmonella enterica TaxID=28901 RepID=UPI00398C4D9D